MSCSDCTVFACLSDGALPETCTTKLCDEHARERVIGLYRDSEISNVMKVAVATARSGSANKWPRLREVITFAHDIGARHLGIASCSTYIREIPMLVEILREEGFEVTGAMCKMGSVHRSEVGIADDPSQPSSLICNSIMQAEALNNAHTDLNIVIGLCVGHDSLFVKNSNALCTTLVVRDQSLGGRIPFHEALERYRA